MTTDMDTTPISAMVAARAATRPTQSEDARMREACREFEGVLIGSILKQGMQSAWSEETESPGADNFRDFALEQTARALGRQGIFGLGDLMTAQMRGVNGSQS